MANSKNPYDALRIARRARRPDSQTSGQPDIQPAAPPAAGLSKSRNPSYTKFTIYIRRDTHLRVKSLAVRHGLELSTLVDGLLEEWWKQNAPRGLDADS